MNQRVVLTLLAALAAVVAAATVTTGAHSVKRIQPTAALVLDCSVALTNRDSYVPVGVLYTTEHPRTLSLDCADAQSAAVLSGLRWRGWGAATTAANGHIAWQVCGPDCTSNSWRTLHRTVAISLSGLVRRSHYRRYYSRLIIVSVGSPAPPYCWKPWAQWRIYPGRPVHLSYAGAPLCL